MDPCSSARGFDCGVRCMSWRRVGANLWESDDCDWHITEVIVEIHDTDGRLIDSYVAFDVYNEFREHQGRHHTMAAAKRYAQRYWSL